MTLEEKLDLLPTTYNWKRLSIYKESGLWVVTYEIVEVKAKELEIAIDGILHILNII